MPKIKRALSDSEEEQSDTSESFVGVPSRRTRRMVQNSAQNKLEYRASHPLRKNLRRRSMQDKASEPVCDICSQQYLENGFSQPQELVFCSLCCKSVHPGCIDLTEQAAVTIASYQWRCLKCKVCAVCHSSSNKNNLILCESCDRGYHQKCLSVNQRANISGNWSCGKCSQDNKGQEAGNNIFNNELSSDTEATTCTMKSSLLRKRACVLKTKSVQHEKEQSDMTRKPVVVLVKLGIPISTAQQLTGQVQHVNHAESEVESISYVDSESEMEIAPTTRASSSKRIVDTPSPTPSPIPELSPTNLHRKPNPFSPPKEIPHVTRKEQPASSIKAPSPIPEPSPNLCREPNSVNPPRKIPNDTHEQQLTASNESFASVINDKSKIVVEALYELAKVIKDQTAAIQQQTVCLKELQDFIRTNHT